MGATDAVERLTEQARQKVHDLAGGEGVSPGAVLALLQALVNGNGAMAQFNHPELGGPGQWMRGGLTMVSDLFNDALKARVNRLCSELSGLLGQQPFLPAEQPGGSRAWWPDGLGVPDATGSQGEVRYAYFARPRRLVVEVRGQVTVYDTLGHHLSGVAQQQGGGASSLTFSSQDGTVRVADLPALSPEGEQNPTGPAPR
jgi:hypothetical protein